MNAKSRIAAGALALAVLTGGALYSATPAHAADPVKARYYLARIPNIATEKDCVAINNIMQRTIYSMGKTPVSAYCKYASTTHWTSVVQYRN